MLAVGITVSTLPQSRPNGSQVMVLGPAGAAPGNLIEMRITDHQQDILNQKYWALQVILMRTNI